MKTDSQKPNSATGAHSVHRFVRQFKCFACSRKFTDTDKLSMHEQNDHPNEYHAAMVREVYGYSDGYDFEPNNVLNNKEAAK